MMVMLLRSSDLGGVQRPGYVVGVVAAAARMVHKVELAADVIRILPQHHMA